MKKIIVLILSFFLLSSCIGNLTEVDSVWDKENRELFNKIGVREYTGLTKEQAVDRW